MSWRLWLALAAFVLLAPPALVLLPCAALLAAAPDRSATTRGLGALAGVLGIWLLALTGVGRLGAATQTFTVLVTVAFTLGAVLRPGTAVLPQALRATFAAALGTALLVQVVWGTAGWDALAWEATREAGRATGLLRKVWVDSYPAHEGMLRFLGATAPGMLALQGLAGLALAWQIHARVAHPALGAPLGRFTGFRFGDAWVWSVVVWLALFVAPVATALKVVGVNVGLVAATLYLLRGAAVVVAFAEGTGVAMVAVVIGAGFAMALVLPLLFVIPGLATLGITDTWFDYRRRLAASRPNAR